MDDRTPGGPPLLDRSAIARGTRLLRAIAHPTRMEILLLLRGGERDTAWLAEALGFTRGATKVAAHYQALQDGGLIRGRRAEGRRTLYRLTEVGSAMVGVFRLACDAVLQGHARDRQDAGIDPGDESEASIRRFEDVRGVVRLLSTAAYPDLAGPLIEMGLAEEFGEEALSLPIGAASRIGGLVSCGLLRVRKLGRRRFCLATPEGLAFARTIIGVCRLCSGDPGCCRVEASRKPSPGAVAAIVLVLRSLSDPVRLRMLALLGSGEQCGCHFVPTLSVPAHAINAAVTSLEDAGLISDFRKDGFTYYALTPVGRKVRDDLWHGIGASLGESPLLREDRERLAHAQPCRRPGSRVSS